MSSLEVGRAERDAPGEEDTSLDGPSLPAWARTLLRALALFLLFGAGLVGLTPSEPPIRAREVLIFAVLPVALLLLAAIVERGEERVAGLGLALLVAGLLTWHIWTFNF